MSCKRSSILYGLIVSGGRDMALAAVSEAETAARCERFVELHKIAQSTT